MKNQFLFLSFLAIVLFSCDKEEDAPVIFLEGSYESVHPATDGEPGSATVMTFSKNGDLLIEHFAIVVDSEKRCINYYKEGTYTLRGENYTETITASFGPDPAAFDTGDCTSKDLLVNNFNPNQAVSSAKLVLNDSKETYTFAYPCNDLGDSMNICLGPRTFTKVD